MEYTVIPAPILGIDKRSKRTLIPKQHSFRAENMLCKVDHLEKVWGYTQLGDDLRGSGLEIVNFSDGSGTDHLIAFTTTHVYVFNGSTNKWVIYNQQLSIESCEADWVSDATGALTHDTTDYKVGSASVKKTVTNAISSATELCHSADIGTGLDLTKARDAIIYEEDFTTLGFWIKTNQAMAADKLSIVLTHDTDGLKTTTYQTFNVPALVADTWTYVEVTASMASLADVLSVGLWCSLSDAGLIVWLDDIRALKLYSGAATDRWAWSLAHDTTNSNWNAATAIVASNNVNKPICWDGTTVCFEEFLVNTAEFSGFSTTRLLFEIDNHFFFADFNDGVRRNLNLKWADLLHCYGLGAFADGTYGEAVVPNTKGSLIRAVKMDDKAVLYCKNSLGILYSISTELLFDFMNLLPVGLFAYNCVVDTINGHQIIGSDQKFYLYQGNKSIVRFGQLVEDWLFDRLNATYKDSVLMVSDTNRNRLYVFYADYYRRETVNSSYLSLNTNDGNTAWEEGTFLHGVTGMAIYDNKVLATANSPMFKDIPANQPPYSTMQANAAIMRDGYSVAVFITIDGKVFVLDDATGLQNDTAIPCSIETGSFMAEPPHERMAFRATKYAFNACCPRFEGSTVSVFYSIDDGVTWTEFVDSPVSLNLDWTTHLLDFDVKTTKVCFKFEQTSGDFWLADSAIQTNLGTRRSE